MTKQKKIAIVCNYALSPNRIGGMDFFYWELDKQLKLGNYKISWLFQKGEGYHHYSQRKIDFDLIDKNKDFTNGMFHWIEDKKEYVMKELLDAR